MRIVLVLSLLGLSTEAGACLEEERKAITPEQILRDKVEGPVRVEFVAEGWVEYQGLTAGHGEPQLLRLKEGMLGEDRLDVLVERKVLDRLRLRLASRLPFRRRG